MKKIPRVFQTEPGSHVAIDAVNPGCEWVLAGEGWATIKIDGTACMIDDAGKLWKRLMLRKAAKDMPPAAWMPANERPEHGDWPGWIPVGDMPEDCWHREAFENLTYKRPGTYELIGPRINRNPEKRPFHILVPHGAQMLIGCPRTRLELIEYLKTRDIEGVVFWHPDGRMAKVRKYDLGLKRTPS